MNNKLARIFNLLWRNPSLFTLKVRRRIARMVSHELSDSGILDINGVRFPYHCDLGTEMKEMRDRCYELDVEAALRKTLKPGSIFVDAGANVGYISALALALVGREGQVHSFEPVPRYYENLKRIAEINPEFDLFPNQIALGNKECESIISITNSSNIGWNTMVPDFMEPKDKKEDIRVRVLRLDTYLENAGIRRIDCLKIDTEGYEFPILLGLENYLEANARGLVIICEVAGKAYSKLGLPIADFQKYLDRYHFRAYDLSTMRELRVEIITETTNVLLRN